MGLKAQVISCAVAVCNRACNPLNVQTQQINEFPGQYGDFSSINPIGTEKRAAAAFGALVCIVPDFLQHIMVRSLAPAILPMILPDVVQYFLYTDLRSSALRTGIFFGSPPPIKKWHLSAQAPHRTQMSRKSRNERYLSTRSLSPSMNISCQLSGSCQSSSFTDHVSGLASQHIQGILLLHHDRICRFDFSRGIHPAGFGRAGLFL